MSRGLTSAQRAAAAGPHRRVVPLLEMYFDSGTLRLALAPWDIVVGGETYIHTGPLLSINPFHESATSTEGIEATITGLDAAMLTIASQEPYRGRVLRLLKAWLHSETNEVIGNPVPTFLGRMQSMVISEKNDECTIRVVAEHYEAELRRPAPLRLNHADQQRLFPGDRGCEYVEETVEKSVVWPSKEAMRQ